MSLKNIVDFIRKRTERRGMTLLRLSVGIIYIWFGVLKFFPATSSAEAIVSETIEAISFGLLHGRASVIAVGIIEIIIGFGFIANRLKYTVPIMYVQMIGTVLPLFIFIPKTWIAFPFVPTLLGQYIIKNMVFIAVAIVLGATERGAKLITDPQLAKQARKSEKKKEQYSAN